MLSQPLPNLTAWTEYFRNADIPVLPTTAEELAMLRVAEEERGNVDAQILAQCIAADPLMTLKVLIECARRRTASRITDAETVTAAIVLMGISPFFRAFEKLPTLSEHLAGQPQALMGLQRVLRRSFRAANLALGFAVHRMDEDAAVIQSAALIHDFAEMLLWCHAPALALRISQIQQQDHAARSSVVQKTVLGIELCDLEQALMKAWHLPELLTRATDDKHADHPQVKTVMLATRIARHTQDGWNTPWAQAALPDDIAAVAELLNLSTTAAQSKLLELEG